MQLLTTSGWPHFTQGSAIVALVGSLFRCKACCSLSDFAHNGVALVAEYVTEDGISEGFKSSRFDAYPHTLHEIVPEPSTFNVW